MTRHPALQSTRPLIFAALAVSLLACGAKNAYDSGPEVPSDNSIVHKPKYIIQATIEEGEMEGKTGPGVEVAHGEPPAVPPLHPWADPTMDSTPTSIQIDAGLADACNIPDAEAFFATDSAELQPEAQAALDALAACFMTGPMKGHRLSITGHADPRGSEAYNKELGWERAAAVAKRLEEAGLSAHEMEQESAGESSAHQDDPAMWPYDRKVVLDVSVEEEGAEGEAEAAEGEGAEEAAE
jgi:outer membrane protein OmpA-like peptidoglycan-associated protein